jgi:hypothetical protein
MKVSTFVWLKKAAFEHLSERCSISGGGKIGGEIFSFIGGLNKFYGSSQ